MNPGGNPSTINPEVATQVKESIGSLIEVPSKLKEIVPQSVWATLNPDQRMELLKQHNLLQEYAPARTPEALQEAPPTVVAQEQAPTVVDAQIEQAPLPEAAEFQQAVEVAKEVERTTEPIQQEPLPAPEQARVDAEQATTANQGAKSVSGYTPSDNLVTNAKQIAQTGPVEEASTWTATLLQKIWAVLGGQ